MASSKEYLDFILEQLTGLEGISYRAMMGEYILYYKNKVIGGIYDNRFLLKITESSEKFIPNAKIKIPYEGAKGMLLFDDFENKEEEIKEGELLQMKSIIKNNSVFINYDTSIF